MLFRIKTSFRYAFSRTRGQRATSIMILCGIAVGLVALLVISAVMNGLQTAQLDQLRNLESFDMIVESEVLTPEKFQEIEQVESAFDFLETNVLVVDKTSGRSSSTRVRAYRSPDGKSVLQGSRMKESLYILHGNQEQIDGIFLSYSMMRKLSTHSSDEIQVTFLKPGKTATIVPSTSKLPLSGYFSSAMTEFSLSTAFMDYSKLSGIIGEEGARIGIYLKGSQARAAKAILALDPDAKIITWQEYNKALYSALTLEKTLMYVFLAFMFLIICVNLRNSTRRLLVNKQKEGAMLRALGMGRHSVNTLFLGQGLIVCLLGEILGVILGKIVIANIQKILSFADNVVYFFTKSRTILTQIPFNAAIGNWEIAAVCLFIFLLSFIFTMTGCRRIYKSEIMEVILNASY